jgi:lysophospholipase L1-like esterase
MPVFLKPGKTQRILFLGDSITYGGLYVAYVETFLLLRCAKPFTFINCGLSSETVSGLSEPGHADGLFPRPTLSERLERVLSQIQPNLVFACYGMNDGNFLSPDSQRFQAFETGMRALHTAVGVPIIHITPPIYDDVSGKFPFYPAVLEQEAAWLLNRRKEGWIVVDIWGPMRAYLARCRESDPSFRLAQDGIHPAELGHWLIAREILAALGYTEALNFETADAMTTRISPNYGPLVLKFVIAREELLRNAWLMATRHQRPGIPAGLPLEEAQTIAAQIGTRINAWISASFDSATGSGGI